MTSPLRVALGIVIGAMIILTYAWIGFWACKGFQQDESYLIYDNN